MGSLKFVAIALIGIALVIWIGRSIPPLPQQVAPVSPVEVISEVPQAVESVPLPGDEDGPATFEGVVIYGKGQPPVPYVQYAGADGSARTKQLIMSGGRGCSPSAGDLPCAGGATGDYPSLNYGDRIRVSGTVRGDQLFVTSIVRL